MHRGTTRVALGVVLLGCGGGGEPATCEAWTTPVRQDEQRRWDLLDVQPFGERIAVLHVEPGADGLALLDLEGERIVDPNLPVGSGTRLAERGDELIVYGATEGGGLLGWSRIQPDGSVISDTFETPGPAYQDERGAFAWSTFREDWSLHTHMGPESPYDVSLAFAAPDGLGGSWQASPSVGDQAVPDRVYGLDEGVVLFGAFEDYDDQAESNELEMVHLDTTGKEVDRWIGTWPTQTWAWRPLFDAGVILWTEEGLLRLGPDGEQARRDDTFEERLDFEDEVFRVGFVHLLGGPEVFWRLEFLELQSGREEIWAEPFDAELRVLSPGRTRVWASHGDQVGPWPIRLSISPDRHVLSVGLHRSLVETWEDGQRHQIDVAQLRCTGDFVPLEEAP